MAGYNKRNDIEKELDKLKREVTKHRKAKKPSIPAISTKQIKTSNPTKTKALPHPKKATPAQLKRRKINYWYNVYSKALELYNVDTKPVKNPTEKTLERMRKKWKHTIKDKDVKATVREAYKTQVSIEQSNADYNDTPRDENLRTAPATNMYDISLEIIQSFIDRVEQIYDDTMTRVQSPNAEEIDYLIIKNAGQITAAKDELIGFVWQMYEDCNQQPEYVARALQENEELEYTIAIAFVPPSNCIILFYETLANLKAIWDRVIADAREMAEQELS